MTDSAHISLVMGGGASSVRGVKQSSNNSGSKLDVAGSDMTEFKSRVFRKRRLSDSSLEKILSDPYVRHAFVNFMEGDEREDMATFWLECEGYQTITDVKKN